LGHKDVVTAEQLSILLSTVMSNAAAELETKESIDYADIVLIAIGIMWAAEMLTTFPDVRTVEEVHDPSVAYLMAVEFASKITMDHIREHLRESLKELTS
jgi:hypothetical protein